MLKVGFLIFMSMSAISCRPQTEIVFLEKDRQELRSLDQRYGAAWLEQDAEKAVMELFSPDAVIIPHHGNDPAVGDEAIRTFFWPKDSVPTKILEFERRATEAGGSGKLGYVRGRFNLKFSFEVDGKESVYSSEGNYLLLAKKTQSNEWKIFRLIWNDPVPREN